MPASAETELRDKVKIGYIVDVPRGADDVCTTRYRVRVQQIGGYAVTGPRVRADGTPMISRAVESEGGYLIRSVPWDIVAQSTIIEHQVRCQLCKQKEPTGLCCSSHGKELCHGCYRRSHFVEVCAATCDACAREGLDPGSRGVAAGGGR